MFAASRAAAERAATRAAARGTVEAAGGALDRWPGHPAVLLAALVRRGATVSA